MTMSIDTRKIVAEIEEEVRRKRATGELPADFERELDSVFARYAPVGALDLHFDQLLEKIDASTLDTIAPLESSRPLVPQLKLVVRKAIGWYVRYIANQLSATMAGLSRALRLLGNRVDVLEANAPRLAADAALVSVAGDLSVWYDLVVAETRGVTGRVLHAECGTGRVVAHLVEAGIDAYGVDPDDDIVLEAGAQSIDVRATDVTDHLRVLDPGSLGAIILSGCVDRLGLGAQVALADLASVKLAVGGRLLVLGTDPSAWGRAQSTVAADLAPGRPLHPETWVALLERRGFGDTSVHDGPAGEELSTVPAKSAGAAAMNANIAMLNRTLFRPSAYAVVATRTH
jgi:SAM-dependent methyltransferase